MDKYYYTISQMPGLRFDRECSMNVELFMEEAGKWMGKRDLRKLGMIDFLNTDYQKSGPRIFKEYQIFEYQLRQDIVNWRSAVKKQADYKPTAIPVSILKEGNPLEIEKKLLKCRWDFIEEKSTAHHFDLGFLILYLLKLQILRKLAEYDKEKGLQKYKETLAIDLKPHLAKMPDESIAG